MNKNAFQRIEPWVFFLIAVLSTIPIFTEGYFTLDGAAHLYNAVLLDQLIAESPFLADYVEFSAGLVPNWTGHAILVILIKILDPFLAEQVFMAGLCFLIVYGTRSLVKSIGGLVELTYFSFPFMYAFTFFLGFYNFTLGLGLFLFSSAYYFRSRTSLSGLSLTILGGLLTLLYFSHIFMLLLALGMIALDLVLGEFSPEVREIKGRHWKILTVFLIPMTLVFTHLGGQASPEYIWMDSSILLDRFFRLKSLKVFNDTREFKYLLFWFIPLVVLFVLGLRSKLLLSSNERSIGKQEFTILIFALLMLSAYFIVPDSTGHAGYITIRIQTVFLLLFIAWLSRLRISSDKLLKASVILVCISHGLIINYYNRVFEERNLIKQEIIDLAEDHIPDRSLVLTLSSSGDWFNDNLYHYLGVLRKDVLVIDNYELYTGYFPLSATSLSREIKEELQRTNRSTRSPISSTIRFLSTKGENLPPRWQHLEVVTSTDHFILLKESK